MTVSMQPHCIATGVAAIVIPVHKALQLAAEAPDLNLPAVAQQERVRHDGAAAAKHRPASVTGRSMAAKHTAATIRPGCTGWPGREAASAAGSDGSKAVTQHPYTAAAEASAAWKRGKERATARPRPGAAAAAPTERPAATDAEATTTVMPVRDWSGSTMTHQQRRTAAGEHAMRRAVVVMAVVMMMQVSEPLRHRMADSVHVLRQYTLQTTNA